MTPAKRYAATLTSPSSRGRYRFNASLKESANDRWRHRRLKANELPLSCGDSPT
jgi:hypothetical protein